MENERSGFGCGFIVFGPGWGGGLGVEFVEIKNTRRGPVGVPDGERSLWFMLSATYAPQTRVLPPYKQGLHVQKLGRFGEEVSS